MSHGLFLQHFIRARSCVCLFVVEQFLKEVHKQLSTGAQGVHAIPTGVHIRDDEQVYIDLLNKLIL